MALEIEVGKNAQAHVTTQSATKVHMMNANYASQLQDIVVEEGGYLEYMPDQLIAPYFALPQQDPAFRRGNREPALRRSGAAGAEIPP